MEVIVRRAGEGDLAAIVCLHQEDEFSHGDAWTPGNEAAYRAAFATLDSHPDHHVYVAADVGTDRVVGTCVLSFLPGLTRVGALHAQLRSVQVDRRHRSAGIGAKMVAAMENEAKSRGAFCLELISNKTRLDAHRFYRRLGYANTHEGFRKVF